MTSPDTVQASPENTPSRADKFPDGLLAAMVALYGCLMALVILAGSHAEGLYYDNIFIFQGQLSDASELSLEAQIGISHDLSVLEQMETHEISGSDPEINEALYSYLSDEMQASLERSGGIDEIYVEEVYWAHNVERENAMISFDLAAAWSERANTYETLATILAVGLAFAAWASLIQQTGAIRWTFTIIAVLMLVGCLAFLGLDLVTREPLDEYYAFTLPSRHLGQCLDQRPGQGALVLEGPFLQQKDLARQGSGHLPAQGLGQEIADGPAAFPARGPGAAP